MNSLEQQFTRLISWLRDNGHQNPQASLRTLDLGAVPEEFQAALGFWNTLSGPSRNLMYEIACGRRLNKRTPAPARKQAPGL